MKTVFFLVLVAFLGSMNSYAGGGGAGPTIEYKSLVQCQPNDPKENRVARLTYFVRSETQWGFEHISPGIYIESDQFSVTMYSTNNDLHTLRDLNTPPESITSKTFYALEWNVRAFDIIASGQNVSLSMIAGSTGETVIKNLKMNCK